MPDLTAAELSIPAEQSPDPAKSLVVPVDSAVVSSTRRFIPWSVVVNPALLNLPPPPPGMQASWVQISQWAAISGFLPFCEPDPAAAIYFDRLSVLRFSVLAASWRRVLGSLSELGVFGTVHVDEDAFRTACAQALLSHQIPVPELFLQWGDLGYSEAIAWDRRRLRCRGTWSTWSAVSDLISRAGELRSAPSGPDDRHRVTG